MKKLSIVVPVYNTEKYLDECLESIKITLNDNFKNVEIIFINDGSTDNSGKICDRYANEYNNIFVYHIENGGVSNARNVGIKNATGDYIIFMDSDDKWFTGCDFQKIFENINKGYDMIMCGSFRGDHTAKIIKEYRRESKFNQFSGGYDAVANMNYNISHICSIAFSSNKIKKYKILFDSNLKYTEDKIFVICCLWCFDNILEIDSPFFIYRYNPRSAMNKKLNLTELFFNNTLVNKSLYNLSELSIIKSRKNENDKICFLFNTLAVGNVLEIIQMLCRHSINIPKIKRLIRDNNLEYALLEYKKHYKDGKVRKKFDLFVKHPYIFALKNRVYWIVRNIAISILPKKLVSKLKH